MSYLELLEKILVRMHNGRNFICFAAKDVIKEETRYNLYVFSTANERGYFKKNYPEFYEFIMFHGKRLKEIAKEKNVFIPYKHYNWGNSWMAAGPLKIKILEEEINKLKEKE